MVIEIVPDGTPLSDGTVLRSGITDHIAEPVPLNFIPAPGPVATPLTWRESPDPEGDGEGDPAVRPAHYSEGRRYEPIDVIEDWGLGFHLGNAVKYIARCGRKEGEDPAECLRKAVWYLEREIARRERR